MPQPRAKKNDDDVEIKFPYAQFVRNASHAIEVAGLLASDPELRTAELSEAEWEARLTEYLNSPRP